MNISKRCMVYDFPKFSLVQCAVKKFVCPKKELSKAGADFPSLVLSSDTETPPL
jgi:hypothetical protein